MSCRTGCPTQDHGSWGDCLRASNLQLNPGDASGNMVDSGWTGKKWDKELDLYASARKQGIQPDGTSTAKVQQALDISEKTGVAYGS